MASHHQPKPEAEPETELREICCPYHALDPRALAWLEGFKAGYHDRHETEQRIREKVSAK